MATLLQCIFIQSTSHVADITNPGVINLLALDGRIERNFIEYFVCKIV